MSEIMKEKEIHVVFFFSFSPFFVVTTWYIYIYGSNGI
jgi:hypothetical protein